jgi:hypothetical protein
LLATALLAILALGGVAAGAAQAFEWNIEGETLAERGQTEQATAGSEGSLTLSGTLLKKSFKMTCEESSSGKLTQGGAGENTLSLSGCAVAEPAGCLVSGVTLTGKTELVMVEGAFDDKLIPSNLEERLGLVHVTNCVVAGTFPLKGVIAGRSEGFPTQQETHTLEFSSAISEGAGTELRFGANPATLTGSTREYLTNGHPWGTNKGSVWGHVGKEWEIAGKTLSEMGLASEAIWGNAAPVVFNTKLLGGHIVIGCSMRMNGTVVKGGTGTATLNLTSCVLTEPAGCTVPSTMGTASLATSLIEVGGKWYVKFQPVGETIISVQINGCSLSGTYPWRGSFSALAEPSGTQLSMQPLAFSPTIDEAAGTGMFASGNPVTITGNQLVSLSGKN